MIASSNQFNIIGLNLEVSMTTNDLIQMARAFCSANGNTPIASFCVDGFNEDPRELCDIPEVIALFRRMIEVGFGGLLASGLKEIDPYSSNMIGLGAVHLWGWGLKGFKGMSYDVNLTEFKKFYEEQWERLDRNVRPHDGQNKTKGGIQDFDMKKKH